MPSVSVVIPAYQAAKYIHEALHSVLDQTFTDFETIIVNDGSPDTPALERILEPYLEHIVYLRQPNGGPSAARNRGITEARADLIAFLDADDLWEPEFLARQVECFRDNPGVDLLFTDAFMTREPSTKGRRRGAGRTFMSLSPSAGPVTTESLILRRTHIATSTVMARRGPLIEAGMFDPSKTRSEDFDLWLRLAKNGATISYQREVLARRRIRPESLSEDDLKMLDAALLVLEEFSRRDDVTSSERDALRQSIDRFRAKRHLKLGKLKLARGEYESAFDSIRLADRFFESWKLKLVLGGLRIAPQIVGRVYNHRERREANRSRGEQPLGTEQ